MKKCRNEHEERRTHEHLPWQAYYHNPVGRDPGCNGSNRSNSLRIGSMPISAMVREDDILSLCDYYVKKVDFIHTHFKKMMRVLNCTVIFKDHASKKY
jgi:hypothetical protein